MQVLKLENYHLILISLFLFPLQNGVNESEYGYMLKGHKFLQSNVLMTTTTTQDPPRPTSKLRGRYQESAKLGKPSLSVKTGETILDWHGWGRRVKTQHYNSVWKFQTIGAIYPHFFHSEFKAHIESNEAAFSVTVRY